MTTRTRSLTLALLLAALSLGCDGFAPHLEWRDRDVVWQIPSEHPDRVILNITESPATSLAVTWRTDHSIERAYAQIIKAHDAPQSRRRGCDLRSNHRGP